jgi:hypothetical protein
MSPIGVPPEPSLKLEKLLKKLGLNILDLEKPLPLMIHQLIKFAGKVANLKLCL